MKILSITGFDMTVVRAFIAFLVITLSILPAQASTITEINGPSGSGAFGSNVTFLPNGNFVVTDPDFDQTVPFAVSNVGAVYLYNGTTGALISALTGGRANDQVGFSGVKVLPNGNYVVISPYWDNGNTTDVGAVTACNSSTGLSGTVSTANSLVGSNPNDRVGYFGVTPLANGNFLVNSPNWNGGQGAVSFINSATGTGGTVSPANSLIAGTNGVGANNSVKALSNGNYLVISSYLSRGAVTWGNGTTGVVGTVSASNSLVGTSAEDQIGNVITELANGNYVVRSYFWSSGGVFNAGAVTWGNGTTGVTGEVSAANSLIGTLANDQIGPVTPLANGNYVVKSKRGVTFGNGMAGVSGTVSAANSLVGNLSDDMYLGSVVGLTNGNYVVVSPSWDSGQNGNAGAVTFCNGTTGLITTISSSNSLVGTDVNSSVGSSGVTALPNGNYVVNSNTWQTSRGAVTFGDGSTGTTGFVSSSNSLVGTNSGDRIGEDGVRVLANGNYVVSSSSWSSSRGAVTHCNGTTGRIGELSAANSLVGGSAGDAVGKDGAVALTNGNYVVRSDDWSDERGAVTFGNGLTGVVGEVNATNSLVGGIVTDRVGVVTALRNGNYVVSSLSWNGNYGAVTLGSGTIGVSGIMSAANSFVGSSPNDRVSEGGVTALANGNFVVRGHSVNGFRGSITWGNGTTGLTGTMSPSNSLFGTQPTDIIGSDGVIAFADGNYIVRSNDWDNGTIVNAGAITFGNSNLPLTGEINGENSVRGLTMNGGLSLVFAYNPQRGLLIVGRPRSNIITLIRNSRSAFDFDGDGKADVSVFRPSGGYWYISQSSNGAFQADQFGTNGDQIVPGDFDGDGKTDISVFRPSNGYWYLLYSSTGAFRATQFGQAGDIPATGDYDVDGKSDIAVYRPSAGIFYFLRSTDGTFQFQQWGQIEDQPVMGDYDGDGKTDFAIFRPSISVFYILRSSDGGFVGQQFGQSGDKPIAGDFDGDGKSDTAVYRPSTGGWYYLQSSDNSFKGIAWGTNGDLPAAGDYDGDAKWDVAVFRPSSGIFYILQSTNSSLKAEQFGTSGDVPVPSAYIY